MVGNLPGAGRAYGDRAVRPQSIILVREGFNPAEISEAYGILLEDGQREFMQALDEIDRQKRRERRLEYWRNQHRRKKMAGSQSGVR